MVPTMIILGGQQIELPGVPTISWMEDPRRVPKITNVTRRDRVVRMIFPHTVWGYKGKLRPGKGVSKLFVWTRAQRTRKGASWDYTVGKDGVIACQNDVATHYSWHCTHPNPFGIGIEMEQDDDGTMYEATVDSAAQLIVTLCERLSIQKQTPWDSLKDRPWAGRIARLDPGRAGIDCIGIFGHRNVWHYPKGAEKLQAERGPGDPNDYVFDRLASDHRFERFDYNASEDLDAWRIRQAALRVVADGIPLVNTTAALKSTGYPNGIWVDHP